MKVSAKDMKDAFIGSSKLCVENFQGKALIITKTIDHAESIWQMDLLSKKIAKSEGNLFTVKSKVLLQDKRKVRYISPTRLGSDLLATLKKVDVVELFEHYPMHQCNPYVAEFISRAEKKDLFGMCHHMESQSWDQPDMECENLNEFVESMRVCLKGQPFKTVLKNFQRSSNKNRLSLSNYIRAWFGVHSKLLVLRIDLGYMNRFCNPYITFAGDCVEYSEVKDHRERLIRHLRENMLKGCWVGHAWKLEYGLDKSYHYHMLILLNGEKVCQDITIAQLIGDHWKNEITDGKGLYWNCNAHKADYHDCGIGMVHYDDKQSMQGLEKAITYLTKPEYYVKMLVPDGHTFAKGLMPKPELIKKGRPRKQAEPPFDASEYTV